MSNVNMNNTGVNCENTVNGNACSLEKTQVYRNSRNKDVEFAAEFYSNEKFSNKARPASLSSNEFEPNQQQKPVSERTAWN